MPAFTRRQYAGAAASTTITAGINTTDTTCTLAATTGWPSTGGVPFYVVIDPGTSAEEKCSATISGSTLTLTRGQDDTSASSHSSGATIYPVFTANDADEANELVSKLTTKGDLLVTTGSALNRLDVGTNAHVLTADSAATNGVKWALSPETDLVTTKGDILVGTAADTLARQGAGSNGEVLVADSSASTGLRYTAGNPIPNPVLNSSFQIWQRGTSFTSLNAFTADRWFAENGTGRTVSRQVTGDATNLPNIQYCLRYQRDSGNTSTAVMVISQSCETADSIPFAGKTVTYSFYARAGANYSAASNSLVAYVVSGTGTDQNQRSGYTGQALPIQQGATLTTTWQRFSFTGTVSTAAKELAFLLEFVPVGTAGANDYFEATGIQLDIGSVALPFRTNGGTVQAELAACQRYYQRRTGSRNFGQLTAQTGTNLYGVVPLSVSMRVPPTSIDAGSLRAFDLVNGAAVFFTLGLDGTNSSENMVSIAATTSGLTAFRTYYIIHDGSTSYLGFSAEL